MMLFPIDPPNRTKSSLWRLQLDALYLKVEDGIIHAFGMLETIIGSPVYCNRLSSVQLHNGGWSYYQRKCRTDLTLPLFSQWNWETVVVGRVYKGVSSVLGRTVRSGLLRDVQPKDRPTCLKKTLVGKQMVASSGLCGGWRTDVSCCFPAWLTSFSLRDWNLCLRFTGILPWKFLLK